MLSGAVGGLASAPGRRGSRDSVAVAAIGSGRQESSARRPDRIQIAVTGRARASRSPRVRVGLPVLLSVTVDRFRGRYFSACRPLVSLVTLKPAGELQNGAWHAFWSAVHAAVSAPARV